MSENLIYGQGTYHRTDMLPDSGDEINSLWARYLAENAEWSKCRSVYMICDYGRDTNIIYFENYGDKNYNFKQVYLLPDVGTYLVALRIHRTAGGTSQLDLAIEPFGTFGSQTEVTSGWGGAMTGGTTLEFYHNTSLGSGWGTLRVSCAEGTLHWLKIWGRS